MTQNYYDLLKIRRAATQDDVKRAYRRLARELHPDVNPDPETQERFKEITQAYEVLSDTEKRRMYDMGLDPCQDGQNDAGDRPKGFSASFADVGGLSWKSRWVGEVITYFGDDDKPCDRKIIGDYEWRGLESPHGRFDLTITMAKAVQPRSIAETFTRAIQSRGTGSELSATGQENTPLLLVDITIIAYDRAMAGRKIKLDGRDVFAGKDFERLPERDRKSYIAQAVAAEARKIYATVLCAKESHERDEARDAERRSRRARSYDI